MTTLTAATAVSGGLVQSGSAAPLSLTVSFDASSSSYTLTVPGGSETFSPSELSASSTTGQTIYQKANGDQLTLITASPWSHKALNYVGLGVYQTSSTSGGVDTTTYSTFDYGTPTPATGVPRTGEAAYNVDLVGYLAVPGQTTKSLTGPGVFEADFLSGQFKANISPTETDLTTASGVTGGGIQLIAVGALSSSDATFSGNAQFTDNVGSTFYVGPITGRFYGPSAQEVGASFSGDNPNGGVVSGTIVGAQAGGAPGENLTLTNFYAQQLFYTQTVDNADISPGIAQLTLYTNGNISFNGGAYTTLTPADIVASTLPNFTTYKTTTSGIPIEFDTYNVGAGNTELALTYMDFGIWKENATIPPGSNESILYVTWGIPTPYGVLSRLTGTGQYTGVTYGTAINSTGQYDITGTSSLTVNFSTQSASGSMTMNGVLEGSSTTNNFGTFNFSGSIQAANPGEILQILPLQAYQGATGVGHVYLQFYGPSAQEAGGPFLFQLNNGLPNATSISGVIAAKQH